jgi:hypothetical protein
MTSRAGFTFLGYPAPTVRMRGYFYEGRAPPGGRLQPGGGEIRP